MNPLCHNATLLPRSNRPNNDYFLSRQSNKEMPLSLPPFPSLEPKEILLPVPTLPQQTFKSASYSTSPNLPYGHPASKTPIFQQGKSKSPSKMCQTILQIHACGCPGQCLRRYCALPMRGCDERARNLERQHLPSSCDRHARLRGRNIPNQPYDDVHPALRRGPKSPSPAPRMFGTLRNPARDLESINMPSARSRRGSEEPRFYSNMRNISEIPHMPQFASSHGRRGSAGISKHGNARKASYSEVQREATYQRQADVRSKRHHYQQCERLVASGRYSQNELSDHPLIQQLSEQDRFTLFYDAEQREREREGERRSRRRGDGQKSRCVVM